MTVRTQSSDACRTGRTKVRRDCPWLRSTLVQRLFSDRCLVASRISRPIISGSVDLPARQRRDCQCHTQRRPHEALQPARVCGLISPTPRTATDDLVPCAPHQRPPPFPSRSVMETVPEATFVPSAPVAVSEAAAKTSPANKEGEVSALRAQVAELSAALAATKDPSVTPADDDADTTKDSASSNAAPGRRRRRLARLHKAVDHESTSQGSTYCCVVSCFLCGDS